MLEKFPNDTSIIEKFNQLRNSILNEKNLRLFLAGIKNTESLFFKISYEY